MIGLRDDPGSSAAARPSRVAGAGRGEAFAERRLAAGRLRPRAPPAAGADGPRRGRGACATTRCCSSRPAPAWARASPTSCPGIIHAIGPVAAADRLDPHDLPAGADRDEGPAALPAPLRVGRRAPALREIQVRRARRQGQLPLHHPPRARPGRAATSSSPTADQAELQRIAAWAEASRDGLRHELQPAPSPEVWEAVNADSSACSRKHCDGERCFYQRARARLRHAQVIIVNHSLLFAHLNAGGAGREGRHAAACCFPTTSWCSTRRRPCPRSPPTISACG